MSSTPGYTTQNDLLLKNLTEFYKHNGNLDSMLKIITGESKISLRIVDWFTTNYAKKYYTLYMIDSPFDKPSKIEQKSDQEQESDQPINGELGKTDQTKQKRFKVYNDYKLKLKAYSKSRFDPFCRWERISIPYKNGTFIETTIGQLNFFKWTLENDVIKYIEENYDEIEQDMNSRNSTSKRKELADNSKTRKKREELSISASKSIKKEKIEIVVHFG
jgi:hypothetical protein